MAASRWRCASRPPNHPIVFREAFVPALDYAPLPDALLFPTARRFPVDLRDGTRYHAVKSELVGQGASARRATLLFPPNARVRMQLASARSR